MCVSAGMKSSGASNNDPPEPATPTTPPPDPNLYTVRAYKSTPQTSGDRITVLAVSLYGWGYSKVIDVYFVCCLIFRIHGVFTVIT